MKPKDIETQARQMFGQQKFKIEQQSADLQSQTGSELPKNQSIEHSEHVSLTGSIKQDSIQPSQQHLTVKSVKTIKSVKTQSERDQIAQLAREEYASLQASVKARSQQPNDDERSKESHSVKHQSSINRQNEANDQADANSGNSYYIEEPDAASRFTNSEG